MGFLNFTIGEKALYDNKEVIIKRLIDSDTVTVEEINTNIFHTIKISHLSSLIPINTSKKSIMILDKKNFKTAKKRFSIIKPLLGLKKPLSMVKQISEKEKISVSTIYRWLRKYQINSTVSSLVDYKTGGKGKGRLDPIVENVIQKVISEDYLSKSRNSTNKVIRKIRKVCMISDLKVPCSSTIRNRLNNISSEVVIRAHYGNRKADEKYNPHQNGYASDFPLSIVQIDHTLLDIILVEEMFGKPYGRPWLTIAIDIYSRMVVGFHLSFDPPGTFGTGMCLANSILEKDEWLAKYDIKDRWPCRGIMDNLHMDNAKEFRGNMLKKAALEYNFNLIFRPVKKPEYGGHIERLCGNLQNEMRDLPGKTFSNIQQRQSFNSEKDASLTITFLEKWLLSYIVKVYHNRKHSTIGMSPLEKYDFGIINEENNNSRGIIVKNYDEELLRLNLMPFKERTVQQYGVLIDHIYYYHEVLRKFINSKESNRKNSPHKKYIFRTDPRDISKIYFYNPESNNYHEIPCSNLSRHSMTVWESRKIKRKLSENKIDINEQNIFDAYEELDQIVSDAITYKKILNKGSRLADSRNNEININLIQDEGNMANEVTIRRNRKVEPFDMDYE